MSTNTAQKFDFQNNSKLSVSEASLYLKITPSTLRRLDNDGKIESERLSNGYRQYSFGDVVSLKFFLEEEKARKKYLRNAAPSVSVKAQDKVVNQQKAVEKPIPANPAKVRSSYPTFPTFSVPQIKSLKALSYAGLAVCLILTVTAGFRFIYGKGIGGAVKSIATRTETLTYSGDIANVLGDTSQIKNEELHVNILSVFNRPSTFKEGITTTDATMQRALFIGGAGMQGLKSIDEITETTLEKALDVTGDALSPAGGGLNNVIVNKIKGVPFGEIAPESDSVLMGNGDEWQSMSTEEIVSLGAVSTGTWEADPVQIGFGGTGLATYTTGDMIYASAADTLAQLNIGTTNQILSSVGGIPKWVAVSAVSGVTGTGVAGYLSYWDTTTNISYTTGMYWDAAEQRLGIGNASPAYKLDVTGTAGFSSTIHAPNIGVGTDDSVVILNTSGNFVTDEIDSRVWGATLLDGSSLTANYLTKVTDANTIANSLIYDSGAAIGIGTTSPSQILDVVGAVRLGANGSANDVLNTTVGANAPSGILYWGARTVCDSSGNCAGSGAGIGGSGTTSYIPRFASQYNIENSIMYDNGTSIGIGTTAPSEKLELAGNLKFSGTDPNVSTTTGFDFDLGDSAGSYNFDIRNSGDTNLFSLNSLGSLTLDGASGSSGALTFTPTGATDVFTINRAGSGTGASFRVNDAGSGDLSPFIVTSTGNVGIGTTNPLAMLSVGNNSQYRVDSSGNLTRINNIAYSWPSSQASLAGSMLSNDASGNLAWSSPTGSGTQGYWTRFGTTLFPYTPTDNLGTSGNLGVGTTSPKTLLDVNSLFNVLSSGNVGIGTTNPGFALDVKGTINSADPATPYYSRMYANGSYGYFITNSPATYFSAPLRVSGGGIGSYTGDVYIQTSGSTIMTATTTGNVGIGTTAPGAKLDIEMVNTTSDTPGNALALRIARVAAGQMFGLRISSTGSQDLTLDRYYGGAWSQAVTLQRSSGNVGIGTVSPSALLDVNGTAWLRGTGTSGLYVNSSGNVGIGTTSPTNKLYVSDTSGTPLYVDGGVSQAVFKYNAIGWTLTTKYVLGGMGIESNNALSLNTGAASPMYFGTNSAERMRLSATGGLSVGTATWNGTDPGVGNVAIQGNVGIGTTGPGAKLEVSDGNILTGSTYGYTAKRTDGTAVGKFYVAGTTDYVTLDSIGGDPLVLKTNGAYRAIIDSSGNMGLGGSVADATFSGASMVIKSGNVGIGTTSPLAMLSVGNNSQYRVDSSGNLTRINNVPYSFPSSQATINGSMLSNDASGNLAWSSPSGTGTQGYWTRFGTTLFPYTPTDNLATSGNMGIGTTSPKTLLDVNSLFNVTSAGNVGIGTTGPTGTGLGANFKTLELSGVDANVFLRGSTDAFLTLSHSGAAADGKNWDFYALGTKLDFRLVNDAYSAATNWLEVERSGTTVTDVSIPTGNVGIGTAGPLAKFHVYGGDFYLGSGVYGGDWDTTQRRVRLYESNNSSPQFDLGAAYSAGTGATTFFRTLVNGASSGAYTISVGNGSVVTNSGEPASFAEVFRIDNAGNVGIGTVSPSALLDVNGTAWLRGTGTSGLYVNSSGNVGIGTTGPGALLDISNGTAAKMYLTKTGAGAGSASLYNDGNLHIKSAAGTAMLLNFGVHNIIYFDDGNDYFDQPNGKWIFSGNIGIGTTNPLSKLEVNGVGAFSLGTALLPSHSFSGDLNTGMWSSGADTINFSTLALERMRIQSDGNVGIGTTSPGTLLEVYNGHIALNMPATTDKAIGFKEAGTFKGYLQYIGSSDGAAPTRQGNFEIETAANVPITFRPALSEAMRITTSGNVGIGTTGPATNLEVYTAAGSTESRITSGSYQFRFIQNYLGTAQILTGTAQPLTLNTNNTERMRISATGGVSVGTATWSGTDPGIGNVTIQGNVGIGTTAPLSKLEVNGVGSFSLGSVSLPSHSFNGDLDTGMWSSVANTLNFSTGGSERLRIDTSGNVGIGTTGPGQLLTLNHATSTLMQFSRAGTTFGYIGTGNSLFTDGTVTDFGIDGNAVNTNKLLLGNGGVLAMTINNGNVGIGTTNPGAKLGFAAATTAAGGIDFGGDVNLYRSVADVLTTGDTFRANVLQSNVTWSPTAGDVGGIRFVLGSGANTQITAPSAGALQYQGVSAQTNFILKAGSGVTQTSNLMEWQNSSGTGLGAIDSAGNVGIGTVSPSALLDVNGTAWLRGTGTSGLYVNSSGNVGIGTTGPLDALQLGNGTARARLRIESYENIQPYHIGMKLGTGGIYVWMGATAEGHFQFSDQNGSALVTFQQAGNVGIGTTGPAARLQVWNTGVPYSYINLRPVDTDVYLDMKRNASGNYHGIGFYGGSTREWLIGYEGGAGINSDDLLFKGTDGVYKMVIQQTGNIGMGYNNPGTAKLAINGNVGIGTTNPLSKLEVNGVGSFSLGSALLPSHSFNGDLDTGMWSSVANTLNFSTGGSERLRIDTSGNVGIGTTGPGYKLDVNSTIRSQTTGGGYGFVLGPGGTDKWGMLAETDNSFNIREVGVAHRLTILTGGNVGIGTTNPLAMFSVGNNSQYRVDSSGNLTRINNVAYSWPSSQATITGSMLSNDASGNLAWSSPSGTGTQGYWTRFGTTLFPYTPTDNLGTSGNMGIGTTSPKTLLDVNSLFNVLSSGNVGIGTTAPYTKLTVVGDESSYGTVAKFSRDLTGTEKSLYIRPVRGTTVYLASSGDLSFATGASDNAMGTERLTITSGAGNVGIGTTGPTGRFAVTDTSNAAASLVLTNNTATTLGVGINTIGVLDLQSTSLTTGNFLNMELNALTSGRGINLTSTSTGLTGDLANITASGSNAAVTGSVLKVGLTGGSAIGTALNITTAGSSGYALRVNDDGTYIDQTPFVVDYAGNVGIGMSNPGSRLYVRGSSSVATVGSSNLLTADGTFAASTGWTEGIGWTIGSGVATHATGVGNTNPLSGTSTATTTWRVYQINFTVAVTTAGDGFTVSLGSQDSGNTITTAGAKTIYVRPSASSGTLSFTPGSAGTFVGTIDDVTIYALSNSTADASIESSDGNGVGGQGNPLEIRAGGSSLDNLFIGNTAGRNTTTGSSNTALGGYALAVNTTGYGNLAVGTSALTANTTGFYNAAFGPNALSSNSTGDSNTATGYRALTANTTGYRNTATGDYALRYNTTGYLNTAIGDYVMAGNTTGDYNTAVGSGALNTNSTGSSNVALGYLAGYYETGSNKLFIDNTNRSSEADGRVKALIYGIFDAAVANQYLTVNGQLQVTGTGNSYFNGNVGIGTTGPGAKLDIVGGDIALDTNKSLYFIRSDTGISANNSGVINFLVPANGTTRGFNFLYGATSRMFVDGTSGNVGIGTTSPTQKLSVIGQGVFLSSAAVYDPGDAAGPAIRIGYNTAGDYGYVFANNTGLLKKNLILQLGNDGGNVGIGTASPTRILGLGGLSARNIGMERGTVADTAGFNLTVNAGGATSGATDKAGGNLLLSSGISTGTGGSEIQFWTAPVAGTGTADNALTQKMVITTAGNVGIGTIAPSSLLHVYEDSSHAILTIESIETAAHSRVQFNTNGSDWEIGARGSTADVINSFFIYDQAASNYRMVINPSGNVGIGTTNPLAMFSVGNNSQYRVDSSGNLTRINNVPYSWPSSQASLMGSMLSNDASGNLAWSSPSGTGTQGYWTRFGTTLFPYTPTDNLGTSGNMGIGTTSPKTLLDVNSLFNVTSAGNVGIGTTAPQKALDVVSPLNDFVTVGARTLGIGGWTGVSFGYRAESNLYRKSALVFERKGNSAEGSIHILNDGGDDSTNANLADARFTIQSNGNIGIGTTAPSTLLELVGTSTQLKLGYNSTYYTSFSIDSTGMLTLAPNGTTAATFSDTANTFALPTSFTASGDVSMAYDLIMSNQTASNIKSLGPLTIEAGESFESNDLTLKTYNQGSVVVSNADASTTAADLNGISIATTENGIITTGTRNIYGINSYPTSTAASTGGTTNLYGAYLNPSLTAATTGSINNIYGAYVTGTGTLTTGGTINQYGVYIANGTSATTGTSTKYGLYVESPTGATNNYAAIFAGGNVGIGTTAPATKLQVDGTLRLNNSGRYFDITPSSGGGSDVIINTNDYITFQTDAGGRVRISDQGMAIGNTYVTNYSNSPTNGLIVEGNVGIGTASPGYMLDVNANNTIPQIHFSKTAVDSGGYIGSNSTANFILSGGSLYNGTNWVAKATGASSISGSWMTSGDFIFFADTGLTVGNTFTPTTRMYINSSGNVGIGTITPLSKLGVVGNASIGATYGSLVGPTSGLIIEGNVGIGTTSPGTALQVQGTSVQARVYDPAGADVRIFADSNRGLIGTVTNHYLQLFTNNLERIRIAADGNVGIGTTGPGANLDIYQSGNANLRVTGSSSSKLLLGASNATSGRRNFGLKAENGYLGFNAFSDDWSSFTQLDAMVFNYNGNVGIGTTGPTNKFDVTTGDTTSSAVHIGEIINEGGWITSTVDNQFLMSGGAEYVSGNWTARSTAASILNFGSGIVAFRTDSGLTDGSTFTPTERMRIDTSGNVGIGTTAPSSKLEVAGRIEMATWTADGDVAVFKNNATGALGLTSSDVRLKKNLTPITNALSIVRSLHGYTYNTLDESDGSKKRLGVLAQDLMPILPEATFAFNVEGSQETYYGVHYEKLTALLVEGIKEQQMQIDTVTGLVENLTNPPDNPQNEPTSDTVFLFTREMYQSTSDNIVALQSDLDSVKAQLALVMAGESAQSSESSSSVMADTPSVILVAMEKIYNEFKLTMEALGLVKGEDGGLILQNSLNVLGDATFANINVTGKLASGFLEIDGMGEKGASIGTISGDLFIMPQSSGQIAFLGEKIVMDKKGNLLINEGVIKGNKSFRDAVVLAVGETVIDVPKQWESAPTSVVVTPSYNSKVWVDQISANGFVIHIDTPSTKEETLYWIAIW